MLAGLISPGSEGPRFIVGMPRSGTTWLCRSLNQHPDVAAFGETMFWGKAYIQPDHEGRYDARALQRAREALLAKPLETSIAMAGPGRLKRVFSEDLPRIIGESFAAMPPAPRPGEVFARIAADLAQAEGKTAWVEKTPHHIFHVGRILEQFPDARIIVTLREPYGFMLSYKHQPGYQRTAASRRRFERRYHPLACALIWRNSWWAARRLIASRPEQVMIVRTEEIESRPAKVLQEVQVFLGLRIDPEVVGLPERVNSSFDPGPRPVLTDGDVAWMNLIAGRAIQSAGYRKLPWSRRSRKVWSSILDLPLWCLRMHDDLKSTTAGPLHRYLWRG